jgi:transcriptional regulator with XRE-family HTH domain
MAPAKKTRRTLPSLDRVIANQIRELRRKRGVSQQRLAELLGETQSTITRIESGERSIAVSEVYRIAAALDCPPFLLIAGGLTGEDVPVTAKHRIPCHYAHNWLVGLEPPPDGDRQLYSLDSIAFSVSDEELERLRGSAIGTAYQEASARRYQPGDATDA